MNVLSPISTSCFNLAFSRSASSIRRSLCWQAGNIKQNHAVTQQETKHLPINNYRTMQFFMMMHSLEALL